MLYVRGSIHNKPCYLWTWLEDTASLHFDTPPMNKLGVLVHFEREWTGCVPLGVGYTSPRRAQLT